MAEAKLRKKSKRSNQCSVEVTPAFGGHVADDRRNRRLFNDGKKKAVENGEMLQAVRFIQEDFAGSQFLRGPARRAINHIHPVDSG